MSDAKGTLVLLSEMPPDKRLIGEKGYDADWLGKGLKARGVRVCIPACRGRNRPATHNRRLYEKRCRIENASARLKDRRGVAMRLTPAAATSSCPPSHSQPTSSSGSGSAS